MALFNQLKMEDVNVNWENALNPFTYDSSQSANLFDTSKTAHNQRVAAIAAYEKKQAELIALFERLDDEEKQKQLDNIYSAAQLQFLENDEQHYKVDCSVLKDLFDDYLETATLPTSDGFLTYLYALDNEVKKEIYID